MLETNEFGQPVGVALPGWRPVEPLAPVTLTGRACRLEPLGDEHADDLWAALVEGSGPELWTYLAFGPFADRADFDDYLRKVGANPADVPLAIVLPDGRAVGHAVYLRVDAANGVAEVGNVAFSDELKRTVPATEAISLMIGHAFELGYRRFEWKCNSLNEPSRRAAERYGFTYEGRFRQALVAKGRNRDTDWYSIVDAEWPAIRVAHGQWLAPENFDVDGRQIVSLRDLLPRSAAPTDRW